MLAGDKGAPMVQIQSKQARGVTANAFVGFIPDILVAWAAAYFFDIGLLGFVGILIGLQCLYFLIWLKNCAWDWLLFGIWGRKKMAHHLEDFLYKNRFPQPPEIIDGIDDYLSQISNNNKMHAVMRVKAATELGVMAGIRTAGRISMALQLHFAFEDALEEYSRRFPPSDEAEAL
jgi:hypothetical protein